MKLSPDDKSAVLTTRWHDWRVGKMLTMQTTHRALSYVLALAGVAAAMGLRLAIESWFGPGLPTYITFYPMVMVVALLVGFGPGMVATVVAVVTVDYWIIPPSGHFSISSPIDQVGLVLFLGMGLFISLVAEGYRRDMSKAAAYDRDTALRENEERWRSAMEVSEMGAWELNLEDHTAWRSLRHDQIFGYQELLPEWTYEIALQHVLEEDRAVMEEHFQRAMAEHSDWSFEVRILRADGLVRWIWAHGKHVSGNDGRPALMFGLVTDITARKKAEEEQKRLTRTLQAFRTTGWALVHACNEADYLREFCRIVVENCSYAMIWIGYREEDVGQSIRPVAHAGFDDGYLDTLQLSWSDNERGRGPTGTAIRTGQVVVCHNMLTDPNFLPWREHALQRGYASSIALPMRNEAGIFGALTIYSQYPDPFIEAEVQMLQRMADELAYGVGVLRLRAQRAVQDQALHDSESKFRAAFVNASIGFAMTTPAGLFIDANDAYCRLTGYSIAELRALSFRQLIHSDDYFDKLRLIECMLAGEISDFVIENRYIRKDGHIIWVRKSVSLVRDVQAAPRWILALTEDISERKEAEEKLRLSEELYRGIGESIDYGVWVCNADGRNTYASESFLNMVGITQQQCSDFGWGDVLHPDDAAATIAAWQECVRTNGDWNREHRFRGVDGGWHHILARGLPIRDEQGKVTAWAGINLDITSLKQAQEEVRANEQRMRLATEATGVGIWEWNLLTDRIHWDAAMFRIYGIAPTSDGYVQYADWSGAVLPEDLPQQEEILQDTAQRHGHSQRAFRIRHQASGELRHIESVETVRMNAQGQAEWVVGTNLDVTKHKQAEQALCEADLRKDEFLAMLAHELRNPMVPIRNAAHILGKLDVQEPRVRWAQGLIEHQVSHLTRLVDDLLDVSRIAQGKITLSMNRIALDDVIRRASDTVQPLMAANGHRFEMHRSDNGVVLDGDLVRLVQVLQNLLNNAAKYTPNGGHIKLTTRRLEKEVEIEVRDNGIGISTQVLPRVFDLFCQAERTLDRSQGGLGIGLTLVKRLVELHGGSAEARSEGLGQGATFIVRLPLTDSRATVPLITTPNGGATQLRVLVVDDDPVVAESMVVFLELDDHQVRSAASGVDALALL
jgi:PAS domain S-box-containing protein